MKSRSGFTLIEVLVTVLIIAILASVTVIAFNKIQQDTRDNTRQGNVAIITDALERYYNKNGEYPSVRSVVNNFPENTGTVVAAKLGIDISALKMPRMPASATNSLYSNATPTNDYVSYIASSDVNNTPCQDSPTGGCDSFTLKYIKETGVTVTIESKHKGRLSSLPTTPDQVTAPALTADLSGTNVVATATATPCESGLIAKFTFRHRINSGSWTSYSSWNTPSTYSVPGTKGNVYDFQASTRCDNGATPGVTSPESAIATYSYVPDGPTGTPVVSVNSSGGNIIATNSGASCAGGSTLEYAVRWRTNDGAWGGYSSWSSSTTHSQPGSQGTKYEYDNKARCTTGSTSSPSIGPGATATYIYPISTPSAPSVSHATVGSTTTWTVSGTCPAGTSKEFQEQDTADWGFTSSWYGPYDGTFTGSSWTTSSEGYQYTENFQIRCTTNYATSSWSASAGTSYIRPITAPGAPTNFVATLSGDRKAVNWTWTRPSCSSGIQPWDIRSARWPPGAYGAWTSPGYWSAAWTQTIVSNGQAIVIPAGSQFQIKAQYECVNATTGRTSAWGPVGESGVYTAP
jgi:prepilin-type N-terminal cleavage/methylation domain-containing protein